MFRGGRFALVAVVLFLVASPALAHVPTFAENNTSPERAIVVENPAKSWSIYDRVDAGQVKYYAADLQAGDRLRVGVFTPDGGRVTPALAVLAPVESDSQRRNHSVGPNVTVSVPAGYRVAVADGERPDTPGFEPFTPAAYYHTASVDRRVDHDGRYLVAVFEETGRSGRVGVAVGYEESFTPREYATVPLDLVRIYQWEGDSPLLVYGPALFVLVVGFAVVRRKRPADGPAPVRDLLTAVALLFAGSAATMTIQLTLALARSGPTAGALVTALFVAVPLALAGWLLRTALDPGFALTGPKRAALLLVAVLGLATWAGFLLGPLLACVAAVVPAQWDRTVAPAGQS